MRAQLPASPDDIDLVMLGTAVKRALGKPTLIATMVGLAGFTSLSFLTPKYASQALIELSPKAGMITPLATAAILLLGLAYVVIRELFAIAQQAPAERPTIRSWLRPVMERPTVTMRSVSSIAHRLAADAEGRTGYRTFVAGDVAAIDAGATAIDLARHLARGCAQVILLDWSLGDTGLGAELGLSPAPGVTEVLAGRASFEDVIVRLPASQAHVITAGSSIDGMAAAKDSDRVDMLLDALGDAYDHILVVGDWQAMRDLFTTMDGRIDLAVLVSSGDSRAAADGFHGFDIADLEVIRYQPAGRDPSGATALPIQHAMS